MRNRRLLPRHLTTALLTAWLATGAVAGETPAPETPGPGTARCAETTCEAEPRRPTRAYGVDWHHDVDSALEAAAERRKRRPVLLLRVLGEVVGKT